MAHVYQKVNSLEKHALIGDGNCVALVQKLTDVGHTSSWKPGERVLDSKSILPGTVIATSENGQYSNRRTGNHAALYLYSVPNSMKTGKPTYIVVMDQWVRRGFVASRTIVSRARTLSIGLVYDDSDNANMFYVVQ